MKNGKVKFTLFKTFFQFNSTYYSKQQLTNY